MRGVFSQRPQAHCPYEPQWSRLTLNTDHRVVALGSLARGIASNPLVQPTMPTSNSSVEGSLCPICEDLTPWTLKVNPDKLLESAMKKECIGCMLLLEALSQFQVDLSSLVYSDDIGSDDFGGPSLVLSGEGYPRALIGDDLEIEIYAALGTFLSVSRPLSHLSNPTTHSQPQETPRPWT